MREEVTNRGKFLARKRRRRGRAERGAFYDSAKGGIEHVHVDGKSQLPLSTSRRYPCTVVRPTETCVAPVDATRDFLYFLRTSSVGGAFEFEVRGAIGRRHTGNGTVSNLPDIGEVERRFGTEDK